jgi:hypothetical protein
MTEEEVLMLIPMFMNAGMTQEQAIAAALQYGGIDPQPDVPPTVDPAMLADPRSLAYMLAQRQDPSAPQPDMSMSPTMGSQNIGDFSAPPFMPPGNGSGLSNLDTASADMGTGGWVNTVSGDMYGQTGGPFQWEDGSERYYFNNPQAEQDIPADLDSLIMDEILSRLINPAGNVLPEQANAHRGMAASRAAQARNRGGASQDIIQRLMGDAQQGDKNRQRAGQDYRFAADTARRGDAIASLAPPPLVANPTSDLGALLQGVQTGSAPANPVSIDPLSVDQTGFSPASGFPHYGPGPMRAAGLNLGQSGLLNTIPPTMEPGLGNAGFSTEGDGYTGMPILDAIQNWFQGHRPIPHPGSPPIDRTPGPSKTTQQGPSKTTQRGNSGTTTSRPGRTTQATQRQSTPRPAPAPTPAPSRGTAIRSFTAPPPATPKSTVPTGVGRSRR